MNYCVDYNKNCNDYVKFDEINVPYDLYTISALITFIQKYPDKKINIILKDTQSNEQKVQTDISTLIKIFNEQHFSKEKVSLCFPNFSFSLPIEQLKKEQIKFFFATQIYNWEDLWFFANLGVSEVYITGELGFSLKEVFDFAKQHLIKIRVFVNTSFTYYPQKIKLKTFFIRPEDIELYSNYIDTIEFFGPRSKQNIFYDIYKNKKEWFGPLNEIISELDSNIDNKYILPIFGEKRLNCKRQCLKNGKCNFCEEINEVSKTLEKAQIVIKTK